MTRRHDCDWRSTDPDHTVWSGGESMVRAGGLSVSLVAGRRCPLSRSVPRAILTARRVSTTTGGDADHLPLERSQANPQSSDPAEWSGRECTGRAANQYAGQVHACRWWATLLGSPIKRDCQFCAGGSPTATGHTGRERVTITARHKRCEHVTIPTRSDGGVP